MKPWRPSFAPELPEGGGKNGCLHDRASVYTEELPEQGEQMKRAEVQKKDQAEHARPANQQRLVGKKPCHTPQKHCAEKGLRGCENPRPSARWCGVRSRVEKRARIHAGPEQQISKLPP